MYLRKLKKISPNNENWCRQIKMHSQYLDQIWSELIYTGFDLKQHSQYYFFLFVLV